MKPFAELETEDRRLTILLLLARSSDYAANAHLLCSALPGFGHGASMDRVSMDIHWLAEQGLVTIDEPDDILVATLTVRGRDVSNGHAVVPGVKRPRPGMAD